MFLYGRFVKDLENFLFFTLHRIFLLSVLHNYVTKGLNTMQLIIPIKDLPNTTEISNLAYKTQEPIFITKNGYSHLVIMSSELYDNFAKINYVDQTIYEFEQEILNRVETVDADIVFEKLKKKHY